jgi:phosphoribosylanthranilate isomerase
VAFSLFPAVDVADGRVARQRDGNEPFGSVDPGPLARTWQREGAQWIHLADIDAALGRGSNLDLIRTVIGELDIDVQLSGGIGDQASLDVALSTGSARVVLSTSALLDLGWCVGAIAEHGDRIAVGLDVRIVVGAHGEVRHRLVPRGGVDDVGELWDALAALDAAGCTRYVVTEASRDATMSGPDLELYRSVLEAASGSVIASGGIGSIDDLRELAEVEVNGARLEGAVVGSALLAGRFTLREASDVVRRAGGTV